MHELVKVTHFYTFSAKLTKQHFSHSLNPRSAFVPIWNSGGYPAVRKKYKAPRGSETSFGELDTSGVDWRYLPCPQRPWSHCRCEIAQIQVRNSPNSGRQLLTINVAVGLTVIPDDRYGPIIQEYGPVDDHMHPTTGSRASSQISFWGEIAEK